MSPARIIPAELAHSLSDAQPCAAALLFPGDEVAVGCGLTQGEHVDGIHMTTDRSRRWKRVSRYNTECMIEPGAAPLLAGGAS